jgi:hypothetical protein
MKMIHAELKIEDCPAELWLNDIPLQRLAPDRSHNVSIPAHLYLLEGQNTLEILVDPGPMPSLARQANPGASPTGTATARLAAYNVGEFTGDANAQILLEVSWDSAAAKPGPYPRSVQAASNLGPMFGRWDWEAAERLKLEAATIDSAAGVIESIRASLAAGDPDVLLRLAAGKFANAARAFPARPFNALVEQFRRVVVRDSAASGWSLPKLDRSQLDFRLAAGGRVLECINRDWHPTLRTVALSDGYPKYYPMLLCRLNGRWQVAI